MLRNCDWYLCCRDYDDFLAELEEDPTCRQNINIYKNPAKIAPTVAVDSDEVDPSVPEITLEEMLDDLTINDEDMAEVYE